MVKNLDLGKQALIFFRLKALDIATFITNKQGLLDEKKVASFATDFALNGSIPIEHLFFFDTFIKERLKSVKKKHQEISSILLKFNSVPLSSASTNKIRQTLFMDQGAKITASDVRRAVVSMLFMPLRQNVGSCFATAPAILVQKILPAQMLMDIHEMLYKGRLSRNCVSGTFTAPMCNFGLEEKICAEHHPLLRAWEYTLATFSDFKHEFYRYNLYNSLGLSYEEEGGLGHFIYKWLQEIFQKQQKKIDSFSEEVGEVRAKIDMMQALLSQADSSDKARRLLKQLEAYLQQKTFLEHEEGKKIAYERKLSTLYIYLKDQYLHLFKNYFQEVYHPYLSFKKEEKAIYEDSLAGFMLLYKGGSMEPSLWTLIDKEQEFTKCLKDFLLATLPVVKNGYAWEEGEAVMDRLIVELSFYIESKAFMAFAKKRAQEEGPFEKLPWVYCSGGSMQSLLMAYFNKEEELAHEKRVVESPLLLLTFFIDTLKEMPPLQTKAFEKDSAFPMLASSPTHAFSLLPGLEKFRQGWEDGGLTYTWIRDEIITPGEKFYQSQKFSKEESLFLLEELMKKLGLEKAKHLKPLFPPIVPLLLWTEIVFAFAQQNKLHSITKLEVASFLKSSLPLFDIEQDQHKLQRPLKFLPSTRFIRAETLFRSACSSLEREKMVGFLESKELLAPPGIIVGDTNWPLWFFSFLYNPLSGRLELWRTDNLGLFGYPMEDWNMYMAPGSTAPWILYVDIRQYSFPGMGIGEAIKV
ncbi:hypothetical protein COB21_03690 [Candidatus Aerophobetes bacterium]|uniref:Uncharacterized protein n=1 Tax=Aerophobetes bacterium TaxID=2030807 RepID=A0A2A4X3T2_UNCAE|nr:MAG: hypothetical protein COB21_03690 [Candidatus Aerophobetes bacterium]